MLANFRGILIHFYFNFCFWLNPNIDVTSRVQIKDRPIIDIKDGAKLIVEENVTLNSRNRTYHVNMFAPVKILAKISGAVVKIGANTRIHGSCIHAQNSIIVGSNCPIAANCQIMDGSGHSLDPDNRLETTTKGVPIVIEDDVWLATGVIVLPGTTIKRGSVVSAGSVVSGTIEEYSLVAGNPAKIKRTLR